MNKKQIETLLHYVTIAMEQANNYKEVYELVSEHGLKLAKQPLSQEEIDGLEIAHCDLELQLKSFYTFNKCSDVGCNRESNGNCKKCLDE